MGAHFRWVRARGRYGREGWGRVCAVGDGAWGGDGGREDPPNPLPRDGGEYGGGAGGGYGAAAVRAAARADHDPPRVGGFAATCRTWRWRRGRRCSARTGGARSWQATWGSRSTGSSATRRPRTTCRRRRRRRTGWWTGCCRVGGIRARLAFGR